MTRIQHRIAITALACAALAGVACGDEHTHGNVDAEGCEHLETGPATPVTATATFTGAPPVSNDHMRYDVMLADVPGGKGGFVSFAASAAMDYVFFAGADVPLKVLSSSMTEVAFESTARTSTACTTIKGRHVTALAVGTYFLSFGPTTETQVSIVIEETAH